MSEQKRYTAQEMREAAFVMRGNDDDRRNEEPETMAVVDTVVAMLRQAADAEEELKLALVTIGNQSDEIAKLKARSNDERFSDWNKVSKMVEEYIDGGQDDFLVTGGGFCIRFKKTEGEN